MSDKINEEKNGTMSRRRFLKAGTASAIGLTGLSLFGFVEAYAASEGKVPILTSAAGVIVADPSRCVGCRRCELACTEYNDGKAHPLIARIKVYRNLNYGPQGVQYGFWRREGKFGNFRLIQETCKQCGHPVPCAMACPHGAIEAAPITGARVINTEKCTGCGICVRACPWEMPAVDPDIHKATKCFLCNGSPECVEACPAGALHYIPWRDLTKDVPIRQVPVSIDSGIDCGACH